jgi:hypothetical protein
MRSVVCLVAMTLLGCANSSTSSGERGPMGPPGERGLTGPVGAQGPQGQRGGPLLEVSLPDGTALGPAYGLTHKSVVLAETSEWNPWVGSYFVERHRGTGLPEVVELDRVYFDRAGSCDVLGRGTTGFITSPNAFPGMVVRQEQALWVVPMDGGYKSFNAKSLRDASTGADCELAPPGGLTGIEVAFVRSAATIGGPLTVVARP